MKISKCENMIYDLSENYLDDYYITKSFLSLSDILVNQGNIFQAKATLESIKTILNQIAIFIY